MIGYIPVIHYHYDSTEPLSDPSVVHADRGAAQAAADQHNGSSQSGDVWDVDLSTDPRIVSAVEATSDAYATISARLGLERLTLRAMEEDYPDGQAYRQQVARVQDLEETLGLLDKALVGTPRERATHEQINHLNRGGALCKSCNALIPLDKSKAGIRYCRECSQ